MVDIVDFQNEVALIIIKTDFSCFCFVFVLQLFFVIVQKNNAWKVINSTNRKNHLTDFLSINKNYRCIYFRDASLFSLILSNMSLQQSFIRMKD